MTNDKHNFEELIAPSAAAKELHISVATLRKYSLIVEKITGNPDYYARTKQKARLYSAQDVQDLKDFHKLAQNHGLTLQEAAQQIFAVSKKEKGTALGDSEKKEVMSASQMMKLLNVLQQTIGQQNTALENLQKQLNRIEKQNKDLLKKQKELEAPATKKKDITSLPDISGIVTDEANNDASKEENFSHAEEVRPLTAAEKRAQILHDKKKSSAQVHEEILAKAKENAQKKAAANEHRTLTDMQVEPEKRHWWQRFIDM